MNIHYHIALLYAGRSEIKFITSFMKPIMKSRLMVVEEINKVELIAFRTFVAWAKKKYRKT